jgi:N-acyl-phosphatidylethanolamine-hydrolysing phospholipase D
VVMPLANSRTLAGLGLRIVELNWWESFAIPGLRITLTPAQHWSNRFVDRNRALWGGFFLNSDSPS